MSSTLLLTVFAIQLVLYLVDSIGAKTINELLWQAYIRLPFGTSSAIQEQGRLRRDVVRLKREMNAISAQDDFARWAKLRRQHDKVLAEYDQKAALVSSTRSSFDTRAKIVRWTSTNGLRLGLQFWHAKTPIFTYPRGWVPWYVEWTLAFPRCSRGGVSINVWSAACATVIALVGDAVAAVVQQGMGMKKETVKMDAKRGEKKVQ